jgi:hypothetical protein
VQQLTDGKPHHVVATYDAATGAKRLYLDGKLCMTMNYQPGTQMVTGGIAPGTIGGCAVFVEESFHGILDEFAWYDFALNEKEIESHYEHLKRGRNYFGEDPRKAFVDRTVRLSQGQSMRFDATNGFPATKPAE